MKRLCASLAVAAGLAFTGLAGAANAAAYTMTPGDHLQVVFYGHEDLTAPKGGGTGTPYIVRPDGKVTFPLVGEMNTAGKTVEDFTKELTEAYSAYLVEPRITINILKLGTTRVYVLGEVRAPGMYELDKSHRVLDALGAARGFTDKSAKKHIYLVRAGSNKAEELDILAYMKKGQQKHNVELGEGDCLYLTSNKKVNVLQLVGQVVNTINNIDEIESRK